MHQKSVNNRMAFYVLVVAIIVGIVSLILVRPPVPKTMGEFFPPLEQIEYFNIAAEGEVTGRNVTRDREVIEEIVAMAQGISMRNEQKSYMGKKYEGTMYHIQMAYSGTEYDFYICTDGSIYHANGKYFVEEKGDAQVLYDKLEAFCTGA